MAKYVLLAFDDDAEADKFIDTAGLNVRAIFKKPTKFCTCTKIKGRGFTRGKKYGWWVCSICKKPTYAWARGELWFSAIGRNLLPRTPEAPEYRGDGIFQPVVPRCPECDSPTVTTRGANQVETYCPKCEKGV